MAEHSESWRVTQPIGAAEERTCTHLHLARPVPVDGSAGCATCRESGSAWTNLLACMECGAVGCCDSSRGRHAHAHFCETGHPLARTLKSGETWGWCYVDEVFLEPDTLGT